MTTMFKVPAGYTVDLDTAFTTFRPAHDSERAERLGGKPTRLQGMLQAQVIEKDGREWPCVLCIYELPARGLAAQTRAKLQLEELLAFELAKMAAQVPA